LLFARWGVTILLSMLPLQNTPQALVFQADTRVLVFAFAVSLFCALLFGLAPAWRAAQVDVTAALKAAQGNMQAKGARRLGRALVACQVGLSVLLLVAAGLFVQTLRNLTRLDLGFDSKNLLQVSIDTRGSGYRDGQVGGIYRLLIERLSAIPGVQSVTVIRNPLIHGLSRCASSIPGLRRAGDETWDCVDVGPSFFETLNIPLVRGRLFTEADFARGDVLYIVNEAFLKRFFPDSDPVGRTKIVGVVGNAKLSSLRRERGPLMYYMVPKEPDRISALEVRAGAGSESLTHAIAAEVRRINPRLLLGVKTLRQEIDQDIAKERMVAATSTFFSVLGLLLASIGIFGVASYTVAQRTNEIGIRMALGAGRWPVIREALWETVVVFAAGLGGGLIASVAIVRLTSSFVSELLFGLQPTDAVNIAAAVGIMIVVALAACVLPARHATRIDPLIAIRYE
jgi:predicted permease